MTHILAGTGATITHTWEVDGTATDPTGNTTTVAITRADGTVLAAAGTATTRTGTGTYTYTLTPTDTAELDLLTVAWTATFAGEANTVTSTVEVVGGHLFTESQLRAVRVAGSTPFTDPAAYPDADLLARREEVTDDFAERCGWSFTPRFARRTLIGDGTRDLLLPHLQVRRVIAASIDGTALTQDDLDDLRVRPSGVVTRRTRGVWTCDADVTISYVHGWDRVPGAIRSAALARAAMLLLPSQSSTVSQWTTPDGTTYSYDQAGQRLGAGGVRHYGVPAIDATLNDPAYNARGLAVA